MKTFAKLLVAAIAVSMLASLFALAPSAAVMMDPRTLTPASERVVFVKDAPRDENNMPTGEGLPGDGSGSDAENPFIPMDHESFDPGAQYPKYHLQTPLYQAIEHIRKTGGTIVICGPTFLGINETYGSGDTTRDLFTPVFGENTIKFTSVWDGVDYRETAGAKITLEIPAEIGVYGQSIWENIDIETASTNRVISFNNYPTLVGQGVNCYPSDEAFEGVAANYVSLSGGHRYAGGVDLRTNLVVQSGTYNIIAAGEWGVNNQKKLNEDGSINWTNNLEGQTVAKLELEGTTKVYGQVIGTNRQGADFSGSTTVIINDGTYECDINVVGPTGLLNEDGQAILKINGGNFQNVWSLNDSFAGCSNQLPAFSLLDFSGWKGEMVDLASAFSVVTTFTKVVLPEGVTEDALIEFAQSLETEPEATEPATPDATQPSGEATKPEATDKPTTPDKDDKDDKEGSVVDPDKDNNNGGNSNVILYVIIGVLVVALVAVIVVLLTKKKK